MDNEADRKPSPYAVYSLEHILGSIQAGCTQPVPKIFVAENKLMVSLWKLAHLGDPCPGVGLRADEPIDNSAPWAASVAYDTEMLRRALELECPDKMSEIINGHRLIIQDILTGSREPDATPLLLIKRKHDAENMHGYMAYLSTAELETMGETK